MAKASMTSETWRCQPCQERVSLWSRPNSFFAVSKLSSIAQRCPSILTSISMPVPAGHQVEKKARSPSAMLRRISRPRVHRPDARVVIFGSVEIGQFAIAPVVQPRAFGAVARRQALPSRRIDARPRSLPPMPAIGGLRLPRSGTDGWMHAKHIAFAGAPQRHLDIADPIDAVGRNPGERHACRNRALDHLDSEAGLVEKGVPSGTCAAAIRAGSSVQAFGKYSARSMKAWPWRDT